MILYKKNIAANGDNDRFMNGNNSSSVFVIYLKGGGACMDK